MKGEQSNLGGRQVDKPYRLTPLTLSPLPGGAATVTPEPMASLSSACGRWGCVLPLLLLWGQVARGALPEFPQYAYDSFHSGEHLNQCGM